MRVYGRLSGFGRPRVGLGLAIVAVVWALSVVSPGAAGASSGTPSNRADPASNAVGMSLCRAPASLRAAVRGSFGAGGPAVPGLKQQAELTASDAAPTSFFGYAVAVSGSTAVVGAFGNNSDTGAAYVFVRSGTKWSQQAELTASDAVTGAEFGEAVAVSGSTVLVGAPARDSSTGAAYVFVRSGTTWTQQAELTASDGAASDNFGYSVALSSSTAVIGATGNNSTTGAAYVFVRSGTTWTQQAELTASDAAADNAFGYAVAVSGSKAVIGAPYRALETGSAYVFVRSGTTWTQQADLTATDGATGDYYGWSVAVSKSTSIVGAFGHNSMTGAAYVYARSGTTWTQQAELNGSAGSGFGYSVAVSGSTAVIGAPYLNSGTGAAYEFARSGTSWSQQKRLVASDGAQGAFFSYWVAVSPATTGSTVVAGAPFVNTDTGSAYVFHLPSGRT